jgi:Ca2+-binding EF-hand superfamily protein
MKPQICLTAILIGFSGVALAAADTAPLEQPQAQMRFQAMDTNRDGRISRAEWRGSDQSFRTHDWNGDGVLSGDEVRPGASRQWGEEDDFDQTRRPEFRNWTERGFTNLDRNRDGRIERAEWFYDREGFIRADRNRDGVLSRTEFLGLDVDADREDRFEYLDVNNNGRVERSEWHGSRDAFDWLDRNNDGVLSRTEVVGEDAEQSDLFGGLDANHDDVITPDEWQWSRRSFARQDQNGDGQLTRGELTNAELQATSSSAVGGAVGTSGRMVVVEAARGWVDTGIDVRRGDRISIDASGTVTLSNNGGDVAEPAGSRSGRRAESAPLRNDPAGALIARINNGAPVLVGNRRTFTAPDSGRLYLSVNDDFFADNVGEYRATVSVSR